VAAGSVAANASDFEHLKGIGVIYRKDKGYLGCFLALGLPVTIDEILASIPPAKILPSARPISNSR
jgi:hypothetical protein